MLSFLELGLDLFESALELGEGDSCLQVLHDLACLVDRVNLVDVLGVLLDPNGVLVSSGGGFLVVALLVIRNVLGDDSYFALCFGESLGGGVSEISEGDDLGLVVLDFLFEVSDELFESGRVGLAHLVGSLLVLVELGGDVVEEDLDFSDGASSGELKLENREDGVSEGVLVDLE